MYFFLKTLFSDIGLRKLYQLGIIHHNIAEHNSDDARFNFFPSWLEYMSIYTLSYAFQRDYSSILERCLVNDLCEIIHREYILRPNEIRTAIECVKNAKLCESLIPYENNAKSDVIIRSHWSFGGKIEASVELTGYIFAMKYASSNTSLSIADRSLIERFMRDGNDGHRNIIKKIMKDYKFVVYNNFAGEWSENLLNSVTKLIKDKVFVFRAESRDYKDQALMAMMDGFINPGSQDSFGEYFEKYGTLTKDYLTEESYELNEWQLPYHHTYEYAVKNNKLYFGSCHGSQHQVLYHGGSMHRVEGHNKREPVNIIELVPGTYAHFYAMSDQEQDIAINQGYFPDLRFNISTAHRWAALEVNELRIGGRSQAGVIESVELNPYILSYQFHPEDSCALEEKLKGESLDRNMNIVVNHFRYLQCDSKLLPKAGKVIEERLHEAYKNAMCYIEEDSCPYPSFPIIDIWTEALEACGKLSDTKY